MAKKLFNCIHLDPLAYEEHWITGNLKGPVNYLARYQTRHYATLVHKRKYGSGKVYIPKAILSNIWHAAVQLSGAICTSIIACQQDAIAGHINIKQPNTNNILLGKPEKEIISNNIVHVTVHQVNLNPSKNTWNPRTSNMAQFHTTGWCQQYIKKRYLRVCPYMSVHR